MLTVESNVMNDVRRNAALANHLIRHCWLLAARSNLGGMLKGRRTTPSEAALPAGNSSNAIN